MTGPFTPADLLRRLHQVLTASGEPLTVTALAKRAGVTDGAALAFAGDLVATGALTRLPATGAPAPYLDRYAPTPTTAAVAPVAAAAVEPAAVERRPAVPTSTTRPTTTSSTTTRATTTPAPVGRSTRRDQRGPVLTAGLHAAGRGWPVFPLRPGAKTPAIRAAHPYGHRCRGECGRGGHGFHDATTDPDVIETWWRAMPRANYGISTGPAGLVVVDLDTGKGTPPPRVLPDQGEGEPTPAGVRDGADVLTWAAGRRGAHLVWDETLTVATPSGGTHLFYAAPDGVPVRSSVGHAPSGRITGLGWSVDVRSIGGYVAGPGSLIPDAHGTPVPYVALIKGDVRPVPGWLLELLAAIGSTGDRPPCIAVGVSSRSGSLPGAPIGAGTGYTRAALAGELAAIGAAQPGDTAGGGRNATVNRAAFKLGRLIAGGDLDPEHVTTELLAAALAVGLPEREAATAIASGLAQGRNYPRPRNRPATTAGRP